MVDEANLFAKVIYLHEKEDYVEASKSLISMSESLKQMPDWYYYSGITYLGMNEFDQAQSHLRQAMELETKAVGQYNIVLSLARVAKATDKTEDAFRYYSQAVGIGLASNVDISCVIYLELAETCFDLEKWTEGDSYFQQALVISQDEDVSEESFYQHFEPIWCALFNKQQYELLVTRLQSIPESLRNSSHWYDFIGTCLINLDRLDEAEAYLFHALEIANDPSEQRSIFVALGGLYGHTGRFEDAYHYYEDILKLDLPPDPEIDKEIYYLLGASSYQLAKWPDSLEYFQRALAVTEPDDSSLTQIYIYLGHISYELSMYAQAKEYYLLALDRMSPDDEKLSLVLRCLGFTSVSLEQWLEARKYHERSLETELDNGYKAQTHLYLGNVYSWLKMYHKAKKSYRLALKNIPSEKERLEVVEALENLDKFMVRNSRKYYLFGLIMLLVIYVVLNIMYPSTRIRMRFFSGMVGLADELKISDHKQCC